MTGNTDKSVIETDVLVIGGGAAGQAAALAASEAGADVTLLFKGPAATAISTGFLTYAAHEGFTREALADAMLNVTGKNLCDRALLDRFVNDGPDEIGAVIRDYSIPTDQAPRGVRVRKSEGKNGRQLVGPDYAADRANDMTSVVMEFSSTHGTALFSRLLAALKASPVRRIKGAALHLHPDGPAVQALTGGRPMTIACGAVILATGGVQGLYEFTDVPATLIGDGQAMALEAGASLVDMEFIQFYPLALAEEGAPTIFIYPDFPEGTRITNGAGEDLIAKHFDVALEVGAFDNWDDLAVAEQREIAAGEQVFLDFSGAEAGDWTENSLTRTFLAKYAPGFETRPVRVAPIAHYTIGGLRVDVDARTDIAGLYACGEVAGGLHGANRHGGASLAEGLTFGRIAGRHAASYVKTAPRVVPEIAPLPEQRDGPTGGVGEAMARLRRLNQMHLGPLRSAAGLAELGAALDGLREEAASMGWRGYDEYAEVLGLRRGIELAECMRRAMLGRTESRGVHTRSDYPEASEAWLKKQAIRKDGAAGLAIEELSL
ncbi:MAG: FAD-dependent oxidoreductase [Alphaproteobacteria bacterium]